VADDTTDSCTANSSDRAAAGENGATNGTDTRTDGGVPVLCRHPGTGIQAEQYGGGYCDTLVFLQGIHGIQVVHNRSLTVMAVGVMLTAVMPGIHASSPA
jgi:hypothetical protein